MQAIAYWKMEETLHTFLVPVRVTNLRTNVSLVKTCIFDTGFSGYLGLDQASIQHLKLPKRGFGKALTASGEIEIETFIGKVELMGTNQVPCGQITARETDTLKGAVEEIPVQMLNLPLLGMKAIIQFRWLLLPDKGVLCLIPAETTETVKK